jgi:lysophospholipase L1-like esterase
MRGAISATVAAIVLCAGVAAGCHGERTPLGPTDSAAAARVPRLAATHFLAFGDSVTAGEVTVPGRAPGVDGPSLIGHLTVVPEVSYPMVLGRRLAERYRGQTIAVDNAGRPGESATRALSRFIATMAEARPDAVLLLDGYNDLESLASITAAATAVAQMVEAAQARGASVFVATLTPGIPGRQRSPSEPLVGAYNALVRTLAASHDVALVDLFQMAAANPSAWIGVDGLHPTEEGYARIADAFLEGIRARLEER